MPRALVVDRAGSVVVGVDASETAQRADDTQEVVR